MVGDVDIEWSDPVVTQGRAVELEHLEREFCFDNLRVRIRIIIEMIWWTGLAPLEFEFFFLGSLTSTFLGTLGVLRDFVETSQLHSRNRNVETMTSCVIVKIDKFLRSFWKKTEGEKVLRGVSAQVVLYRWVLSIAT